MLNQLKK